MSSFFSSGRVDTARVDRKKLPALRGTRADGKDAKAATYRIRLTDVVDHVKEGGRTQFDFVVVGGALAGKRANEIVMHDGYSAAWKKEKARGTCAIVLGSFAGFNSDQAQFKITNEFFAKNGRTVQYDGTAIKSTTCSSEELPLVQKGAEAYLVVSPYFDRSTGNRKYNQKAGQMSVTYNFYPLSANLEVTQDGFEGTGLSEDDESDAPPPADDLEEAPQVDALALALAAGWKVNPNAPSFFYLKGSKEQLKEAELRAKFSG